MLGFALKKNEKAKMGFYLPENVWMWDAGYETYNAMPT